MRQSTLLVVNASAMFSRMALTFGVGLYATRLLVNLLGHSDYGLLATLGASGTMLVFIGRGLNASAQRGLAYELGRGDTERLETAFLATLVLFVGMGLVVVMAGLLFEPWLIRAIQIPPGREQTAARVFVLTLLNLATVTATTPFRAVLNARQAMGQVATFELLRSLSTLVCVLLLFVVEGDSLLLYATFLLTLAVVRSLALAALCAWRFPESRPRLARFDAAEVGRVSRFAGWAVLVNVGFQFYNQAALVLLGTAFAPVVTAAYAIAMRVGEYHNNFARVLPRVVQPAMTTLEARGRREPVQALTCLTGLYSGLGMLFFAVPIFLEAEGILRLWLGDYPPGSPLFVRITLAGLLVQALSSGFDRAVYAHGQLARYALASSALWLATLALAAYWLFGLGLPAWTTPATILASALAQVPLRVGFGGGPIGVGYAMWARRALVPATVPCLAGLALAWTAHVSLADGWPRYGAVLVGYAAASAPAAWLFAVGEPEKRELRGLVARAWARIRPSPAR